MNSHTSRQWQGKFFRCGMRCFYCCKPLSLIPNDGRIEIATKDHLTPTSRGGSDTIDNIVPACFDCNRKKGDMTEPEFRGRISEAFTEASSRLSFSNVIPAAGRELSLAARDEPSLERLRKESEGTSWAWRNGI